MRNVQSTGFTKKKKVECQSINWYYRSWKGDAKKGNEGILKEF